MTVCSDNYEFSVAVDGIGAVWHGKDDCWSDGCIPVDESCATFKQYLLLDRGRFCGSVPVVGGRPAGYTQLDDRWRSGHVPMDDGGYNGSIQLDHC